MDGVHHACDAYVQSPDYFGPLWNLYILRDVYEPSEWYRARHLYAKGIRNVGPSILRPLIGRL